MSTTSRFTPGDRVRILTTRYQGQLATVQERTGGGCRPGYSKVKVDGTTGASLWLADANLSTDLEVDKIDLGAYLIYRFGPRRVWVRESKRTGHIRPLAGNSTESLEILLADTLEKVREELSGATLEKNLGVSDG